MFNMALKKKLGNRFRKCIFVTKCIVTYLPKNSFFTSLILLSQFDFFAKRIRLSQSIYRLANLTRLSHFLASLTRLSHFLANLILLSQSFLANRIRLSQAFPFLANLILLSQTPLLSISSSSSEKKRTLSINTVNPISAPPNSILGAQGCRHIVLPWKRVF